eukprot:766395-Hanusia_phi.AAC.3
MSFAVKRKDQKIQSMLARASSRRSSEYTYIERYLMSRSRSRMERKMVVVLLILVMMMMMMLMVMR